MLQFDREVAPERIVHARGMTAFGTFEVTHDISNLTSAAFLNGVGSRVCELQMLSCRHALLICPRSSNQQGVLKTLQQCLQSAALGLQLHKVERAWAYM